MNPGCVFIFCSCSLKLPISFFFFYLTSSKVKPSILALPEASDERVGGAVVLERRFPWPSSSGAMRLARTFQLDPPLIERVDVPDRPLGEDAVLVEGHQLSEHVRGQPIGEDRIGGMVARNVRCVI